MIERLGPRARPLYHLVVARALEFLREPDAVFWVYVFPLFLVVALGIAFRNRPVEVFHVAVARGGAAETVAAALVADERFQAEVCDEEVCRQRLRTGRVDLIVIAAPAGETSGGAPQYEFLFDPTRPENLLARNAADDFLQRRAGRADVVITSDHPQTDPGGRYIDFLIPGLVGMGLMGGGLWGVGFAIVDMRIRKLLKRYLATPVRRSDFMASLILSRLIFTVPEVALVVVFAHVVFGVTVSGSYLLVGLLILLGSLQFSGLGLLVAARAQTIETVMGLMNAVMLPMWIGSGIFFSIERFPAALQPLLYALPLTPLIHALRLVMLEGAGLTAIAPHLLVIAAWAVVSFALALRWFRWT
jgi:ABC-type multidrug transport system permease subunit